MATRLATWDPIAHGDRARHARVSLVGAGAAAAVTAGAWIVAGRRSRYPLAWGAAVLLAADVTHYARLAHPISRGAPLFAIGGPLGDEPSLRRDWIVETSGAGRVAVEDRAVTLSSPAGSAAYLLARVPDFGDAQRNWLIPIGPLERERFERVDWRASVRRTGEYYVVAELRRLLLQVAPVGLHVTYPDARDELRGHELPHAAAVDGQVHDWAIERSAGRIALSVDRRVLWSAESREPITQVRFGDSRNEASHGGAMRLERASFAVSLDRS